MEPRHLRPSPRIPYSLLPQRTILGTGLLWTPAVMRAQQALVRAAEGINPRNRTWAVLGAAASLTDAYSVPGSGLGLHLDTWLTALFGRKTPSCIHNPSQPMSVPGRRSTGRWHWTFSTVTESAGASQSLPEDTMLELVLGEVADCTREEEGVSGRRNSICRGLEGRTTT